MYKVLIIDDEPWARKVIKKLGHWERLDLEVIDEASDGEEGLEKIKVQRPHIVITDMRMPGLDGGALLKSVNDYNDDIQIIAMSGYNDFIYLKQAIKSGAVDYLLKPVKPEELNDALVKSIERLDKNRKDRLSGFGTLHLFEDREIIKGYLEYRQHVYEGLNGLKSDQTEKHIAELCAFLKVSIPHPSLEMITKIGHDLIQMLQVYVVKSESDYYEQWKMSYLESIEAMREVRDFEDMFAILRTLYVASITTIIKIKKGKKHLDTSAVHEYMTYNYCDTISLESVAAQFFVTKEHLSRAYKASYDTTINEALIILRMDRASALIIEQQLAIKDVALMVGYNDLAYFYRVFKKHFGVAPGEYRDMKHINNVQ
jgi:two-component system response regulator YesN